MVLSSWSDIVYNSWPTGDTWSLEWSVVLSSWSCSVVTALSRRRHSLLSERLRVSRPLRLSRNALRLSLPDTTVTLVDIDVGRLHGVAVNSSVSSDRSIHAHTENSSL